MAIEGAEAEEVYQEQPQEPQVAEENQELGTDFADFFNTQGKPRFIIYPSVLHKFTVLYNSIYALSL